jgi:hypothetical protein
MTRLWIPLGLVALLAVSAGSPSSVLAQGAGVITGAVSGSGGPIAGVTVNVVNDAGTVVGTAVTSSAGAYTIGNLAFGTYTIQVVGTARRVVVTGVGTVSGAASTATVNLTLTDDKLAPAAIAAGGGGGAGGMTTTTKAIIATAAAAGAGVLAYVATRADSSPTR